jgi:hypothetical protein
MLVQSNRRVGLLVCATRQQDLCQAYALASTFLSTDGGLVLSRLSSQADAPGSWLSIEQDVSGHRHAPTISYHCTGRQRCCRLFVQIIGSLVLPSTAESVARIATIDSH